MKSRLIAFIPLIACVFVALMFLGPSGVASDSSMIKNFQKNKDSFEKLAAAMTEDEKAGYIGKENVTTKGHLAERGEGVFSSDRWTMYQELFNKVGISYTYRPAPDELHFTTGSVAVSPKKNGAEKRITSKEYVYSTTEPADLCDTLDDRTFDSTKCYRQIDDRWYLYFESSNK